MDVDISSMDLAAVWDAGSDAVDKAITLMAEIIAGEAHGLCLTGKHAVAGTLEERLVNGQTFGQIAREYKARGLPAYIDKELARQLFYSSELVSTLAEGFMYCLSKEDVARLGCRRGDVTITCEGNSAELHLYKEWPLEEQQ